MTDIIQIDRLVYGGNGMGRLPDGKAVFVPFVVPGETAQVRIRKDKGRFAFADLEEVLAPDPARINPLCAHFGKCGGCHYQHIPYPNQVSLKKEIFIEQLQRIAKLEFIPVKSAHASKEPFHYRNAMQFHLTAGGDLAFMDFSSANPFAVKECHLPMETIGEFWPNIGFEEAGDINRIEICQNSEGEVLTTLTSKSEGIPEIEIGIPINMAHICGTDQVVLSGDGFLYHVLMNKRFKVSAGSFFQRNYSGAIQMIETIADVLRGKQGGVLWDLYCGVGLFSAFFQEKFDRVIGVEASPSACLDYLDNLNGLPNVGLVEGMVEKVLPRIKEKPDIILMDPPRKGLDRFAIDAIKECRPKFVIYVSCDPATLARDIKRLGDVFALESSVIIDVFPQTYHIESVNVMRLK